MILDNTDEITNGDDDIAGRIGTEHPAATPEMNEYPDAGLVASVDRAG